MSTARRGSFYQLGLWGLAKAFAVFGLLWVGALILAQPPRHYHYYSTSLPWLSLGVAVVAAWILPVAFWLLESRLQRAQPVLRLAFSPYRGIAAGVILAAAGWFEPTSGVTLMMEGFSAHGGVLFTPGPAAISHSVPYLASLFLAGFLGFGLTGVRSNSVEGTPPLPEAVP